MLVTSFQKNLKMILLLLQINLTKLLVAILFFFMHTQDEEKKEEKQKL